MFNYLLLLTYSVLYKISADLLEHIGLYVPLRTTEQSQLSVIDPGTLCCVTCKT